MYIYFDLYHRNLIYEVNYKEGHTSVDFNYMRGNKSDGFKCTYLEGGGGLLFC